MSMPQTQKPKPNGAAGRPRVVRPRPGTAKGRTAPDFDAETVAVARVLLEAIRAAVEGEPGDEAAKAPTPVQLKDLAAAARNVQALGRQALGLEQAAGTPVDAIVALLNEIDGEPGGASKGG